MASTRPGTKRRCPECGAKFYDFGATTLSCPKCQHEFSAQPKAIMVKASHSHTPIIRSKPIEELEGESFDIGPVTELEELDDFDDDVEHLEEVEDHHEDPETDINSDDAEDEMFIDEIGELDLHIIDEIDDDYERDAV